jgi:hypothetical protein
MPADRHLHLPACRQCRHERGRHRDGQHGRPPRACAACVVARPTSRSPRTTAPDAAFRRLAQGARHHRPLRHRYARADRAHPRQGHAQRRHRPCARRQVRSRRAEEGGRRLARHRRHGPRARRDRGASATTGTRRRGSSAKATASGDRAEISRRRHRLRRQAQHPAPAGRGRLQGDGRAGDDARPRTFSP